jgi:hypothetical protein
MDFLKKHYEKVLLGLMLAGLIGVLVFMIFYITSDKADMDNKRISLINPPVKALTNLDLTLQEGVAVRLKSPYVLDLETTNKLLNPLEWQKSPDGTLIPVTKKIGLQVAVVTNITPLYFVVEFTSTTTNELGARYVVSVERQAAPTLNKRHRTPRYISKGDKPNDTFALLEVKGPPENPDALVLKLVDSNEVVTISHDKPYRRIDAYAADFRYDPERKVFRGKRIGDKFSFGGVDYSVVEVNQNELILSDQSNQKKTSLPFVP